MREIGEEEVEEEQGDEEEEERVRVCYNSGVSREGERAVSEIREEEEEEEED